MPRPQGEALGAGHEGWKFEGEKTRPFLPGPPISGGFWWFLGV